jgi:hypothetical protein
MSTEKIIELVLNLIDRAIEWGAEQIGESTDTVRERVLRELAGPSDDPTDTIAGEIDAALPDGSDR